MTTTLNMRSSRIVLVLGLGLGLGLAGCNDNEAKDPTVSSVARQEIGQNTSEIDDPIFINDLALSGRDTKETSLPQDL